MKVYVCGAVACEGYVEVEAGSTYAQALQLAGLLTVSVLPSYASTTIDSSRTSIVVGYNDGQERQCVNLKSTLIVLRTNIDGIAPEIVNKLADYIEEHGKFTNKQQLELALGADYLDNYYKFFVAEEDYEESR